MRRVRVRVRMSDELYRRLLAYARVRGVSVDEVVREAIWRLLRGSGFRGRVAGYPAQPVEDGGG